MSEVRPMRADAVRNRTRIIDAARSEVAARGIDVGMDDIARAAGVAVGTLYRHFPTKTDLITAVVDEYVVATVVDAEESRDRAAKAESSALVEIVGFLQRVVESSAEHHAVKAAALTLGVDGHGGQGTQDRVGSALRELLTLGKADGDIRDDVVVEDLFLLMTSAPTDRPLEVRQRWFHLVLPGITTDAAGRAISPTH